MKEIIPFFAIFATFIAWCITFYYTGKQQGKNEERLRWLNKSMDELEKRIKNTGEMLNK